MKKENKLQDDDFERDFFLAFLLCLINLFATKKG